MYLITARMTSKLYMGIQDSSPTNQLAVSQLAAWLTLYDSEFLTNLIYSHHLLQIIRQTVDEYASRLGE